MHVASLVPTSLKNEAGNSVTVNGVCYRHMITDFLWLQLDDCSHLDRHWFQQDDETYHTNRQTMDILHIKIGNHVISHFGDVNWSSAAIWLHWTFLWGNVKDHCYFSDQQTIDAIKENIHPTICEIENVLQNSVNSMGTAKPGEAAIWMELFSINYGMVYSLQ